MSSEVIDAVANHRISLFLTAEGYSILLDSSKAQKASQSRRKYKILFTDALSSRVFQELRIVQPTVTL